MCGIAGIKPTLGRVSRYGAMPLSQSLDCIGVLARSVGDCARLLSVIAGADDRDGMSSRQPVEDYERGLEDAAGSGALAGVTIGVPDRYYYDGIDPEVAELLAASRALLEKRGAQIVDVPVGDHGMINDLANAVVMAGGADLHLPWLRERPQDYSPQVRARLLAGVGLPATLYLQALQARSRLLDEVLRETFAKCDVLHIPVLKRPVPTAAETDVGGVAGDGGSARANRRQHASDQLSRPARPLGAHRLYPQRPAAGDATCRAAVPRGFIVSRRRGL